MPKLSYGKVQITNRDKILFKHLFLNKISTTVQLKKYVFGNISKQAIHKRLDKLQKAKLLEAKPIRELNNKLIYFLTEKTLFEYISDKTSFNKKIRKSTSVLHDLDLVEIRDRFLKLSSVNDYFTENHILSGFLDDDLNIKSIKSVNPDAILNVNLNSKNFIFTLEYERSEKFYLRYENLIKKYHALSEVNAVLFISNSKATLNKVLSTEKKIIGQKSEPKFFFCTLEDVLNMKGNLKLSNFKNEVLLMT